MTTPNLITLTDPRSAAAEAFRTLRTNLMFSSVENPIQAFLVTSSVDGEGKSDALANLAVTFAQGGNKTILVDADLRRPSQHTIWGVKNNGLTSMMIDDASLALNQDRIATTGDIDLFLGRVVKYQESHYLLNGLCTLPREAGRDARPDHSTHGCRPQGQRFCC